MQNKREIRYAAAGIELRTSKSADMTITGRPAVYNSKSKDLGGFNEVLLPGCFDDCLGDDPDIRGTVNHNDSALIGRTTSGTLQVSSDAIGLKMRCQLPNNTVGRDLYESIQRGDINKMSFGMFVDMDDWSEQNDNGTRGVLRSVKKARIFEVSCVTDPAYEDSSVSARSLFPEGLPLNVVLRMKALSAMRESVPPVDSEEALRRSRSHLALSQIKIY
jgi:HK97 family phage prohead protease